MVKCVIRLAEDSTMDKFLIKKPRVESCSDPKVSIAPQQSIPSTAATAPKSNLDRKTCTPRKSKGRTFQTSWMEKYLWLDYDSEKDCVFCRSCKSADTNDLLKSHMRKDPTFISDGFINWKKALEKFRDHESSKCHKEAVTMLNGLQQTSVACQLSSQHKNDMIKARSALSTIFTSLRYLCRQGLPIRGHSDFDSNYIQLLHLRKTETPELAEWMNRSSYKWTSHDIQNEMIHMMANAVLRKLLSNLKASKHFTIIIDETTDSSVKEQVAFCVRSVNEDFEVSEEFLGLYETSGTEANILFQIVKDILIRFELPFDDLRGQCFDGASNMSGKLNGLQKLIRDEQPKAIYVHCAAHSLNLSVEDSLRDLSMMRDIMHLAKDLINTVRESPKRSNLFKDISQGSTGLRPLCPTRWTMRASSMQQIIKNYDFLLQFFDEFSGENKTDAGAKCSGYVEKMTQFSTYFLFTVYCDIMSPVEEVNRTIQCPKLGSAELDLIINDLTSVLKEKRNKYESFWAACIKKKPSEVEEPTLPRSRRIPKRLEGFNATKQHEFKTPQDYCRKIYYEVLDTVVSCIERRYSNTGLQAVVKVEKQLLAAIESSESSLEDVNTFFEGDIDSERLPVHLSMLRDIVKDRGFPIKSLMDVKQFLTENKTVRDLLSEVTKCVKLLYTIPITSATAERSFSALRRLKSFLRTTITQKRLNDVAVLHTHQDELDKLDLKVVINEFILSNPLRQKTFALYEDC